MWELQNLRGIFPEINTWIKWAHLFLRGKAPVSIKCWWLWNGWGGLSSPSSSGWSLHGCGWDDTSFLNYLLSDHVDSPAMPFTPRTREFTDCGQSMKEIAVIFSVAVWGSSRAASRWSFFSAVWQSPVFGWCWDFPFAVDVTVVVNTEI